MNPLRATLVLRGGHVLSLDATGPSVERADVLIDGERISAVVSGGITDPVADAEQLDVTDCCIVPGLVDLHFHTALGKGRHDDLPLDKWIAAWWYPVLRAMDPDVAYWAGMLAYSDALRSGTTCVNDMSRQLPALARAATDVGLRVVLANTIAEADQGLDGLEDTIDAMSQIPTSPLVGVRVGIEWMPYETPELLRDARQLADDHHIGLHVHLNESRAEVALTEERHGMRPTELAYECGLLGPDCVAAHGVCLSDNEIGLLAQTGTFLSHNASSNAKLGNGVAPLGEILAAGVTVGLGHDGAESNNSRDLFEVMKFTSLIHRATQVDPSLLPAGDILTMATANGASALGTGGGRVVAGATADLTVVDLKDLTFAPLRLDDASQLAAHLVFSADGANVGTVIVNGEVVYEHHRLTRVDEDAIRTNANRCFAKVLDRVGPR